MSRVVSLSLSKGHHFSKETVGRITLQQGLGVAGDAHNGITVKHRSRVARDPFQPNLRQVHLIHDELLDELVEKGFDVRPGDIGENILTRGIDLLSLPTGTRLHIGASAVVELTGLRNPCAQLDKFQRGLTAAVLDRDDDGNLIRKAGVMAIVIESGDVHLDDGIDIVLPPPPHRAMEKV